MNDEQGRFEARTNSIQPLPGSEGAEAMQKWLSLSEAAQRLNMSQPYVAQLCHSGRLGEVTSNAQGKLVVPAAAVDAHLAAMPERGSFQSIMEAAQDAGMYDLPEERYVGYRRGQVNEEPSEAESSSHKNDVERVKDWLVYGCLAAVVLLWAVAFITNRLFK